MPPPSVECYICGKMFGTHSIKIHERQCLKQWHYQNDSLPANIRPTEPVRKDGQKIQKKPSPTPQKSLADEENQQSSVKKAPMFPCYICGRLFTVDSIYTHEPQCLKLWKVENEKLPPHKRRPQPIKSDIKFTHYGKIDYEATNDVKWQSPLSQLVRDNICLRTFNPVRVEKHKKSCKG